MASREVIIERIGWDSNNIRPLAKSEDAISKMYNERYPHYMSFWNTYHTGNDSVDEIARKIHVSQYI
jgi:shikimate kinase